MSQEMSIIVGGVVRVLAVGAMCATIQPVLADPEVFPVLRDCAIALARIGVATGGVLAVGYTWHHLQLWASQRPVMPAPSKMFATMAGMSPTLQREAAIMQAEDRQAVHEQDYERQTRQAVIRFAIIGENERSFAYRTMRPCLDRPTWDRLTQYLGRNGVLRVGTGTKPTWFRGEWDALGVRHALKNGRLPLPDNSENVPEVVWYGLRHAVHTSKHTNTQASWKG
jgi:hypothetical protein